MKIPISFIEDDAGWSICFDIQGHSAIIDTFYNKSQIEGWLNDMDVNTRNIKINEQSKFKIDKLKLKNYLLKNNRKAAYDFLLNNFKESGTKQILRNILS